MDIIEKDPLFYKIVRPILKFLFCILYRPTIIGKEKIPKEGRVVLAGGSHKHNFDCLMLIVSTKRCVHFLAKDELYQGITKGIFKHMGIIPVNRRKKDGKSLQAAISFLKKDLVIGIFPEGRFNQTENSIIPFKMGAVKMAKESKAFIVPFVIKGKYRLFRKGPKIIFLDPFQVESQNLEEANIQFMKLIADFLEESEETR